MHPASLGSQSNMETTWGSIWDKQEWQQAQSSGLLRARECIHLKNAVDCRCMRKHVTIVDRRVHRDVWFRSLLITLAGYLRSLGKPTPADEAWSFLQRLQLGCFSLCLPFLLRRGLQFLLMQRFHKECVHCSVMNFRMTALKASSSILGYT